MTSYGSISWDEALIGLRSILPGIDKETFSLDVISEVAQKSDINVSWQPVANWEELNDAAIFRHVVSADVLKGTHNGILLPAMCFYGYHLPFVVRHDDIVDFVGCFALNSAKRFSMVIHSYFYRFGG